MVPSARQADVGSGALPIGAAHEVEVITNFSSLVGSSGEARLLSGVGTKGATGSLRVRQLAVEARLAFGARHCQLPQGGFHHIPPQGLVERRRGAELAIVRQPAVRVELTVGVRDNGLIGDEFRGPAGCSGQNHKEVSGPRLHPGSEVVDMALYATAAGRAVGQHLHDGTTVAELQLKWSGGGGQAERFGQQVRKIDILTANDAVHCPRRHGCGRKGSRHRCCSGRRDQLQIGTEVRRTRRCGAMWCYVWAQSGTCCWEVERRSQVLDGRRNTRRDLGLDDLTKRRLVHDFGEPSGWCWRRTRSRPRTQ